MTRHARTALTLAITAVGVGAVVVCVVAGAWPASTWCAVGTIVLQTLTGLLPDRRHGPAASPPALTITRTTRGHTHGEDA